MGALTNCSRPMRLTFTVLLFLIGTVSLLPYYKKGKKGYYPHVGRAAVGQDDAAADGGEAAPEADKEAEGAAEEAPAADGEAEGGDKAADGEAEGGDKEAAEGEKAEDAGAEGDAAAEEEA